MTHLYWHLAMQVGLQRSLLSNILVYLQAFSSKYVEMDHQKTSNALYLQEKWHKVIHAAAVLFLASWGRPLMAVRR
jgi:hypothetical protein